MKAQIKTGLIVKQRGAAVLLISIVLLIGVTLVTVFAARVGVMDQRISANEKRHTEAYAAAEAGLNEALSYVRYALGNGRDLYDSSILHTCDGTEDFSNEKSYSCDAGGTFTHVYDAVVSTSTIEKLPVVTGLDVGSFSSYIFYNDTKDEITVVSQGNSEDETGSSTIQNSISKISILTTGPIPPIMAPTSSLSGSFTVVPNPNLKTTGSGVPISAWVSTYNASGDFESCHAGEFLFGAGSVDKGYDVCTDLPNEDDWASVTCQCDADHLISDGNNNIQGHDIVVEGPGGLPDPYTYVFGTIPPETLEVTSYGIDDCSSATLAGVQSLLDAGGLRENYSNRVWVRGDCDMQSVGGLTRLGGKTNPIVLIVEDETNFQGGAGHLWGIVFSFGDIDVQGTPTVHGSLVAAAGKELGGNGNYTQVYDEDVFSSLFSEELNSTTARVAYQYCDSCN